MANTATIYRGTARTFRATITGADGTETMKLVIGDSVGVVGDLVLPLSYSGGVFSGTLTAAMTEALDPGGYYAVVWKTDSGEEDLPVANGRITIADAPRAS